MSKVIELRGKLKSIGRINKMTEAMQVVAVTQLKKVQARQRAAQHYKLHYERMINDLGAAILPPAAAAKPVTLAYALFSDRGFCGGFNEGLIAKMKSFIGQQKEEGKEVAWVVIGKKGRELCRERKLPGVRQCIDPCGDAGEYADEAVRSFRGGAAEKVVIFFNRFISMLLQRPDRVEALPLEAKGGNAETGKILVEPDQRTVMNEIGLNYIKALFYDAFAQTRLGEVSSRLVTMRGATESSKEMIGALNIMLNKARQSAITMELAEIISSFEILAEGEE